MEVFFIFTNTNTLSDINSKICVDKIVFFFDTPFTEIYTGVSTCCCSDLILSQLF